MNTESKFADPADSIAASYWDHPVDHMEPIVDVQDEPGELEYSIADAVNKIPRGWNTSSERESMAEVIFQFTHDLQPRSKFEFALRQLFARIFESNDPLLEIKSICAAVGLDIPEESLSHVGVTHGVGRAAVSKRVRKFQKSHGIVASSYNKNPDSREEYRAHNVRKHKKDA